MITDEIKEYEFVGCVSFQKMETGYVLPLFKTNEQEDFYTFSFNTNDIDGREDAKIISFDKILPHEDDIVFFDHLNDGITEKKFDKKLKVSDEAHYFFLYKKDGIFNIAVDKVTELRNNWNYREELFRKFADIEFLYLKLKVSRFLKAHRLVREYKQKLREKGIGNNDDYINDFEYFDISKEKKDLESCIGYLGWFIEKQVFSYNYVIVDNSADFYKSFLIIAHLRVNLNGFLEIIKNDGFSYFKNSEEPNTMYILKNFIAQEYKGHKEKLSNEKSNDGTLINWFWDHKNTIQNLYGSFFDALHREIDVILNISSVVDCPTNENELQTPQEFLSYMKSLNMQ